MIGQMVTLGWGGHHERNLPHRTSNELLTSFLTSVQVLVSSCISFVQESTFGALSLLSDWTVLAL